MRQLGQKPTGRSGLRTRGISIQVEKKTKKQTNRSINELASKLHDQMRLIKA